MELDKLKNRAAEAFAKGKFNRAAELYEEYCQKDARDMQARIRMGDAWARSGKREKAITAYQSAAEGFARSGFFPRAIAASKLVLELDPTHKGVQHILADLYALKKGGTVGESISAAAPPSSRRASRGAVASPGREMCAPNAAQTLTSVSSETLTCLPSPFTNRVLTPSALARSSRRPSRTRGYHESTDAPCQESTRPDSNPVSHPTPSRRPVATAWGADRARPSAAGH